MTRRSSRRAKNTASGVSAMCFNSSLTARVLGARRGDCIHNPPQAAGVSNSSFAAEFIFQIKKSQSVRNSFSTSSGPIFLGRFSVA
jgi:hypothetical protein